MKRSSLIIGANLAMLASAGLISAQAANTETSHEAAIKACSTANPQQPVTVLYAVEDGSGIGFSLVWLEDKEGGLWLCDADADGNVYAYSLVMNDLLEGGGAELIGIELISDESEEDAQEIAEKVCVAYLDGGGKVLVSAPDGLEDDPGFVVFVEDQNGNTHLCNATGDAMIWAFEPISDPIEFETQTS